MSGTFLCAPRQTHYVTRSVPVISTGQRPSSPCSSQESTPSAPESIGICPAPIHGRSVPPHSCLDIHAWCAGHSTRAQGYGLSGRGVGPRRGLPRSRRARHLGRRAAPQEQITIIPRREGDGPLDKRGEEHSQPQCARARNCVPVLWSLPLGKARDWSRNSYPLTIASTIEEEERGSPCDGAAV